MAKLYRSAAGPVDAQSYQVLSDQLNLYSDEVFGLEYTEAYENDPLKDLFRVIDHDTGGRQRTISSVSNEFPIAPYSEDGQTNLQYATAPAGHRVTVSCYPRRLAVAVTQNAVREDGFDKVMWMAGGAAAAIPNTVTYLRAGLINDNAFSGTGGADALSIFNDSHTNEAEGTGTFDNYYSGIVNYDNFWASILLAINMTGPSGRPLMWKPTDVYCHPTNYRALSEYIGSPKVSIDALNAITVKEIANLTIHLVPLFTTTAMVMFADRTTPDIEKGLLEVYVSRPENLTNSPTDATIVLDKQYKVHVGVGFHICRKLVGLSGS